MKTPRNIVALLLVLLFIIGLAGCGGAGSGRAADNNSTSAASQQASAENTSIDDRSDDSEEDVWLVTGITEEEALERINNGLNCLEEGGFHFAECEFGATGHYDLYDDLLDRNTASILWFNAVDDKILFICFGVPASVMNESQEEFDAGVYLIAAVMTATDIAFDDSLSDNEKAAEASRRFDQFCDYTLKMINAAINGNNLEYYYTSGDRSYGVYLNDTGDELYIGFMVCSEKTRSLADNSSTP